MSFTLPGRLQRLDENLHQRLAPWQRQALLLIAFVLLAAPIVGFQARNDRQLGVYAAKHDLIAMAERRGCPAWRLAPVARQLVRAGLLVDAGVDR